MQDEEGARAPRAAFPSVRPTSASGSSTSTLRSDQPPQERGGRRRARSGRIRRRWRYARRRPRAPTPARPRPGGTGPCATPGARKSPPARPGQFGRLEKRQALAHAPLHLQDVRDDVDRGRMTGIERERPARRLFGPTILAVFLEAEGVHRQHARIPAHVGVPLGQNPRNAVAQHPPPAEPKVERMREASATMSRGSSTTIAP